jgi:hypothetical protein
MSEPPASAWKKSILSMAFRAGMAEAQAAGSKPVGAGNNRRSFLRQKADTRI